MFTPVVLVNPIIDKLFEVLQVGAVLPLGIGEVTRPARLEQAFPEVDRAEWLPLDQARLKILDAQVPLLEELEKKLG